MPKPAESRESGEAFVFGPETIEAINALRECQDLAQEKIWSRGARLGEIVRHKMSGERSYVFSVIRNVNFTKAVKLGDLVVSYSPRTGPTPSDGVSYAVTCEYIAN